METTRPDIESEADVAQLVNRFYERVRQDKDLGPIFTDVARVDWEHHIPRLVGFWSTVLLGAEQYRGNPVRPHLELAEQTALQSAHFARWLALFSETVDELFAGDRADLAKMRAQSIATVLQSKLYVAGRLDPPGGHVG